MPRTSSQLRTDRVRLLAMLEDFFLQHLTSPFARQTYQVYKALVADSSRYLSLSQDEPGKVSYAEKVADRFSNRRRRRTTLARYIRRQMEIGETLLSDYYLAELQNHVVAQLFDASQFIQIVTGDAIRQAYNNRSGAQSCMTGTTFIDFYVINPEKVALIQYDNGRQARALLWTTDQNIQALDRIYPTDNGPHMSAIKTWARAQGYRVAYEDDCSDLTVTMQHEHLFPYLDNFCHARFLVDNKIVLGTTEEIGGVLLHCTDGGYEDENTSYCCQCEGRVDEEETYYVGGNAYCERCWNESFFCCIECESDVSREDGIYIESHAAYICSGCASRLTVHCGQCNAVVMTADTTEAQDGRLCPTCAAPEANREAI